jgi:hypothetical protein
MQEDENLEKEKNREYCKKWREKNAEALREYQKKWRTINVNKTKEYHKNWRASHREDWNKICRESRQRSKAKKLEAELKTKENTNQ